MKKIAAFGLALTLLAACGADGEPVTPTMNAGVSIGPYGVYPHVNVGTWIGPFRVNVGL